MVEKKNKIIIVRISAFLIIFLAFFSSLAYFWIFSLPIIFVIFTYNYILIKKKSVKINVLSLKENLDKSNNKGKSINFYCKFCFSKNKKGSLICKFCGSKFN